MIKSMITLLEQFFNIMKIINFTLVKIMNHNINLKYAAGGTTRHVLLKL